MCVGGGRGGVRGHVSRIVMELFNLVFFLFIYISEVYFIPMFLKFLLLRESFRG